MLIDTACSSGLVAIHNACLGLKNGDCTMAIAGGVRIRLNPIKNGNSNNGISSKDEKTKTFDDESDGTGSGEGVIVMLLKPYEKALADRDHIYAIIRGSAINQDGNSAGITAPNPEAQEEVIIDAWKNAGIDPTTISYIECHGTGTKLGDPIEIAGITGAFQHYTKKKQFCAVGSLKSNLGHLDSLAGVAGMLKAVLTLKNKEIPPLLHFKFPNRNIEFENSPVYVCTCLQKWMPANGIRRCGVSAFGLSGTNCHMVLEEAPEPSKINYVKQGEKCLFTISAKTVEALKALVQTYEKFIEHNSEISLVDMCYTTNVGREHYKYRIAIVTDSMDSLIREIKEIINENGSDNVNNSCTYSNLFYANDLDCDPQNNEAEQLVKAHSASDDSCLKRLALLYVNGADIAFKRMYAGKNCAKISLPTYPFQNEHCWIDLSKNMGYKIETPLSYQIKWYENPIFEGEKSNEPKSILIFVNKQGKGKIISERLRVKGNKVIEVQVGSKCDKMDQSHYEVALEEESFKILFDRLSNEKFDQVIHALTMEDIEINHLSDFATVYKQGLLSVLNVTKSISLFGKVSFIIISPFANCVLDKDKVFPMNSVVFGWAKGIISEFKNVKVRCIDIDLKTSDEIIAEEIEKAEYEYLIAYRENKRYIQRIEDIELDKIQERKIEIKENGTYVVTGGNGRVGKQVCMLLAENRKVNIISLNRSRIDMDKDLKLREIENQIRKNGSSLEFLSTDITNHDSLNKSLSYIRQKYGRIDGVIHCAAIGVGKLGSKIEDETEQNLVNCIGPKVQGTWLLENLTKSDQLDFMILFSSNITLTGGKGSSAYIAGNSYLDAFPDSVASDRILAINFPRLFMGGETYNDQNQLYSTMRIPIAMDLVKKILTHQISRCIIGDLNLNGEIINIIRHLPFRFGDSIQKIIDGNCEHQSDETVLGQVIKIHGNMDNTYTDTEKKIAQAICNLLELDEVDIHDNFFEIGGNSIFAIKLESDLEKVGIQLNIDELGTNNTVELMAASVEKQEKKDNAMINKTETRMAESECALLINQIEPFNDIFYKSCFYNSLIPILIYYGKDFMPIIVNDICVYQKKRLDSKNTTLTVGYLSQRDPFEIVEDMGIQVFSKEESGDIIHDLVNALKNKAPVIIWVDCYYASIRKDVYHKKHQGHTWLVYGVDEEQRVFYIIEHSIRDNLFYKKKEVSFEDLELAYQGFLLHFQKEEKKETYHEFGESKREQIGEADCKSLFNKYIIDNGIQIREGLKLFWENLESYQILVLSEANLHNVIDKLVEALNDIINAKKIELYRSERIYSRESRIYELNNLILKQFQKIRGIMVKYQYAGYYHQNDMERTCVYLKDIYCMECECVDYLVNENE